MGVFSSSERSERGGDRGDSSTAGLGAGAGAGGAVGATIVSELSESESTARRLMSCLGPRTKSSWGLRGMPRMRGLLPRKGRKKTSLAAPKPRAHVVAEVARLPALKIPVVVLQQL